VQENEIEIDLYRKTEKYSNHLNAKRVEKHRKAGKIKKILYMTRAEALEKCIGSTIIN
jgi:DNA replication initiation complex subunit (GINS family)